MYQRLLPSLVTNHFIMSVILPSYVGIQPWEEKYREMAFAMGIDPSVSSG